MNIDGIYLQKGSYSNKLGICQELILKSPTDHRKKQAKNDLFTHLINDTSIF